MSEKSPITEADLHAYVDRELDARTRAEVDAWLADHPEAAARVGDFRRQKSTLHDMYDGVLDEPLPAALTSLIAQEGRRPAPPLWLRIAASLMLIAIGGLAGWAANDFWRTPALQAQDIVSRAASAHTVYVAEVRHAVEVGAGEAAHLVGWLSKRLGAPLKAPALDDKGFELVGGRLLPDKGNPAAQFMYENSAGQRITVYLRRRASDNETSFRFTAQGGLSAFYWVDGPFSYALIGDMPRQELLVFARLIYAQLGS